MKGTGIVLLGIVTACCILLITGAAVGKTQFISIGTGGTGGIYYPYGGGVAEIWSKYVPGVKAVAEVTGADRLLLVGHQPTWSLLVRRLTGQYLDLRTAILLSGCGGGKVSYANDVQPIFDRHCTRCHGVSCPNTRSLVSAIRASSNSMPWVTSTSCSQYSPHRPQPLQ